MARKTTPEVKEEQKVQTKYDRKMAARKEKEEKSVPPVSDMDVLAWFAVYSGDLPGFMWSGGSRTI